MFFPRACNHVLCSFIQELNDKYIAFQLAGDGGSAASSADDGRRTEFRLNAAARLTTGGCRAVARPHHQIV
jgi:hypothetical protein